MVPKDGGDNLLDDPPPFFFLLVVVIVVVIFKKSVVDETLEGSKRLEPVGVLGDVIGKEIFYAFFVKDRVAVMPVPSMVLRGTKGVIRNGKEGHAVQPAEYQETAQ